MRPGETLAGRPDELRRALREQAGRATRRHLPGRLVIAGIAG